ncbi:MAG: DUF2971 domain-containing protein [Prevotellaceae bacterium]|jgi:DNA-binding Lrp family transcriptional regulator|nr:DUF2971 domain-containing protein [Prevotellaceae bacterium]
MEDTIKSRIKKILSDKKITINFLSKEINIPQKTLSNQINGRQEVGIKTILAIIDYFKDIDLRWLLTGNKSLLKGEIIELSRRILKIFDIQKKKNSDNYTKQINLICNELQISEDILMSNLQNYNIDLSTLISIKGKFRELNLTWLMIGEIAEREGEYPLLYGNSNENMSLYHYTSAETLLKIIGSMKLKYGTFNKSNDPKERKAYKVIEKIDGYSNFFKNTIENDFKYISFFKYQSSTNEYVNGKTLPRMWAQYASPHEENSVYKKWKMTGACIEFDIDKIKEKVEEIREKNDSVNLFFGDIEYRYGLYRNGANDIPQNNPLIDYLSRKHKGWEKEQEYRLIYGGNDEFLNISNCIKKIFLGDDFIIEDAYELKSIIEKNTEKINVIKLKYNEFSSFATEQSFNEYLTQEDGLSIKDTARYWEDKYKKIKELHYECLRSKDVISEKLVSALEKTHTLRDEIDKLSADSISQKNILVEMANDVFLALTKAG